MHLYNLKTNGILLAFFPKVALVLENYLKHSVFHFLLDLINYLKK
ncbi:Uncharacterised protein [Klebsiella pneumoniae]|nr:Uncharacterised protein [Klebsiella pneumoniae]